MSTSKGGDLDEKIRQWREAGRTFEESLILDWFIQLTTAVRYIHERRILHRDLKTRYVCTVAGETLALAEMFILHGGRLRSNTCLVN